MGCATSVKRESTITKANIQRAAAEAMEIARRRGLEKVEVTDVFSQLVDYPKIAHPRHASRFMRLLPLVVDVTKIEG